MTNLVPYATHWNESRGRQKEEPLARTRSAYQRDRDRIIHCTAFRRLGHKTQVFIAPEGDHIRTRLTHSLEVAQIARSIARALRLDEDLSEAIALAHDLGHPPFGHMGEEMLNELMRPFGGFNHNDQTLRIVVRLENRYPDFLGLNLTWETLEGIVKHNGPVPANRPYFITLRELESVFDLESHKCAGLEAQVAAIADDIAYNNHDLDDGFHSGLFSKEQICDEIPHIAEMFCHICKKWPDAPETVHMAEIVRQQIGKMVEDVLLTTERNLKTLQPKTVQDIRSAGQNIVALSHEMKNKEDQIRNFLLIHMYSAPAVTGKREHGVKVIKGLFHLFYSNPDKLPEEWRVQCDGVGSFPTARVVADYMAGMTDRYASNLYKNIVAG